MSATQKVMGHVYAIFTILVWGSCFVLTKVMLTAYTPTQIIPLRMGLAYITLWALRPKTLKLPWRDELMFILIGITGGSFYFFLQNTGLRCVGTILCLSLPLPHLSQNAFQPFYD